MLAEDAQIRDNITGIGIKQRREFGLLLNHAESARIKSDYMFALVIKEDLEENIIEKMRKILMAEGVLK